MPKSFKEFLKENLTLQYHEMLNPRLWRKDKLLTSARKKMLKLAHDFMQYAGIQDNQVQDIIFTGSNTNYNYTKYSDIDIHILGDGLGTDELYDKKNEWQFSHNPTVDGYPAEVYCQEANQAMPSGQGVYSLLRNEWVNRPAYLGWVDALYDQNIQAKINYWIWKVQGLLFSKDKKAIERLKMKFWRMRSAGLEKAGEFSEENMIYKELRNLGYIDKLNAILREPA